MADNQQTMQTGVDLNRQVALLSSQTTQWITDNLKNPEMAIAVPKGYNVGNEVASLIFAISQTKDKNGRTAFDICDSKQIMNQVRNCVLNGLSITKKHVYPIIYDGKFTLQISYFGTLAALSYMFPYLQVYANVLYEGDEYELITDPLMGFTYVTNVRSKIENHDKPIIAAYGNIIDTRTKERVYGLVMSWNEIQKNWAKSKTPPEKNSVQKDFPQEMAKRTLINRMCKMFVNSGANTNTEQVGAFNRMTEAEYVDVTPQEATDKEKLLHSKSKGAAGLESLLESSPAPVSAPHAQNAPSEAGHETTQSKAENAPEQEPRASETKMERRQGFSSIQKPERKPSVMKDQWGNIIPTPEEGEQQVTAEGELINDDSLPF